MLKTVPLFALLDDEETAVLASQADVRNFAARERIYKIGDMGGTAYVMISGKVRVTTVDESQQEVVVDEPGAGDFFGFASMLEQTPHQTLASAIEDATCLEISQATTFKCCWSANRTRRWTCSTTARPAVPLRPKNW